MSDQSDKPISLPEPVIEGLPTADIPERRRVTRYSFIAVAEVFDIRSQTRLEGRCSDLSMGGCYVDTLAPFPIDSALRVTIQHDSREFQAMAVVTYCHPSMGMGIKFTEIEPEFRNVLCYWVVDLCGEPIPKPEPTEAPSSVGQSIDADSNMRLVLNELVTLLVRKKIITEMEGAELLFRALR
ncbi:MAG TPA: PilZ domain-containing protein [Candidatus Acidoferrales bacterium]|nr:PilZ domain-containing protein [Candidatus Acidoferrales bacterium]